MLDCELILARSGEDPLLIADYTAKHASCSKSAAVALQSTAALYSNYHVFFQVKRLMGRSYYDDDQHKFIYRVRPTLKSHSLKGVRAAVEIPCGKFRKKLAQPELISALILRHIADHAQR